MAKRRRPGNPLALAVLALLAERPTHPYEMAQVLKRRHKEQSIKIKYGSLYTVVQNLEKHGFLEVAYVQREGRRPERTLYQLTPAGSTELHDWLADLVAVPAQEYPAFGSALSLLLVLPVDEVDQLLQQRLRALEDRAAHTREVLDATAGQLPRVFLVEVEYHLHMVRAEIEWIRALRGDLASGALSGVAEWRAMRETGEVPREWAELEERIAAKEPPER